MGQNGETEVVTNVARLAELSADDPWRQRMAAYQESRELGIDPPCCYTWDGPCYCRMMPPDQLCSVCIETGIALPLAPCRRGVWPHDWQVYATGDVYGQDRHEKRTLRKACRRCHANEELPGKPFTLASRPFWWVPFALQGMPVRRY
jgi:hypothetical protein